MFAADGIEASTEDIAEATAVGIGTVVRHFPTKEALLREVLMGQLSWLKQVASELATSPDPGEALFIFLERAIGPAVAKTSATAALRSTDLKSTTAIRRLAGIWFGYYACFLSGRRLGGRSEETSDIAGVIALSGGLLRVAGSTGPSKKSGAPQYRLFLTDRAL
jgi:AcrR family transcriptional regulator